MFWYESQLYSIDRVARIGGSEGKEEGGARKRATRAMTMTMTRKFLGWSTRASQSGHPDPIMKKKSRTEAFSQVYVCAQNPVHTCSHAAVCCSAGGFFLALLTNGQWTAKNFRGTRRANSPRLFYPPRGGDRDRVRILARIHRVSPPPPPPLLGRPKTRYSCEMIDLRNINTCNNANVPGCTLLKFV